MQSKLRVKPNKAFIDIRLRPGISPKLAPYGPLRPNVTSSINRKYLTYRNATRGGPSHGSRGSAQKCREGGSNGFRDMRTGYSRWEFGHKKEERRNRADLTEVIKMAHGISSIKLTAMFCLLYTSDAADE